MNRVMKSLAAFVAIFALMFVTGCSTVSTDADEVALHYSDGAFSSKKFKNCVTQSNREVDGPGNQHYRYPAGQRTFSFTGAEGSERRPIAVTTKDGQEVQVPGFVTFTLTSDCDKLREFHERIGIKYKAYADGGGWTSFVNDYIYTPLDAAMNQASIQAPGWYALYSDSETQAEFTQNVKDALPAEVKDALGDDFIEINTVNISKPGVSDELKDGLSAREEARLQNQAQEERNEVSRTKYDSLRDCRQAGISEQACITIYLSEQGDIPFYPLPQGGALNVNPQPAG